MCNSLAKPDCYARERNSLASRDYVYVCMYVCVYVCPLISAASHTGITKETYQRAHSNTGTVLNFADSPKIALLKSYGVICLPRAAPAS